MSEMKLLKNGCSCKELLQWVIFAFEIRDNSCYTQSGNFYFCQLNLK